ncbi:phenylalanine--tRNA ligase subunit beta [Aequorivita vladivostokensis]|uniref:Phenylalanine--tRNA ligase beta subunit n=1 Tax=Aequorivita vladivostokensis TaxID=171194 RepID=A0ABR5DL40_9FLAO|nr:phenylalanine--tRNA ligase subunit beta [Aequorivita vladivostokensis]KJJ39496.1 phenylalanyl-tRNA synthetase subunit beta [Aequorivita vladivostokensis]MAB58008.1 phenylalanine--tRNA ligase subunit beta [Aequorivita sp.]MAO48682.1 phenylalanine--tRNA ligase subunit beta [Aequorivita sp.]MBF31474.1 phenylalanine--tRNA ligase subunit beta [Aequorivita sp.]|tara:strand:+ start:134545 stop:136971 length:2427 start_codon:yes stop_codon:yes gene_type:complete
MTISYNWLKQFINLPWDAEKTGELLTDLGLEVEGIEDFSSVKGGLEGVVVGHVLECAQHTNADRLKVTKVDVGSGAPLQIVCGAPNVAVGQKVPVATVGTTLYDAEEKPWQINKGKIRGEVSEGMICAEDELGIGKSHDGIMVLDAKLKPGTPLAKVLEVENDKVYEIGLTPNRADAMSHWGVARDLKAGLLHKGISAKLNTPSTSSFRVDNRTMKVAINVEDSSLAPRYCGITIGNLKVGPSPAWLQNRLKSIGLAPINNIVDVTNYVLHELGQPLHAFDAGNIAGNTVNVKTLPAGTKFTTLDGIERELHEEDLMICDAEKPMCIAGVFGGINSGVTENTTSIFLESAYFNPVSIRKTAKRHGLSTDASFRFERGIDPNIADYALRYASILILKVAGGQITSDLVDIYPKKIEDHQVFLTFDKANKLIGEELPKETIKDILTSLEMKVSNVTETGIGMTIPAYRNDVTRDVDVIEEILRVYGYNNIKFTQKLNASISTILPGEDYDVQNKIALQLTGLGFNEMLNNSLTTTEYGDLSDTIKKNYNVTMLNPLSKDLSVMRQSMLFSGLEAIEFNSNRKNSDLKFFEFGKTYHNFPGGRTETKHLALFITGLKTQGNWASPDTQSNFFFGKGTVTTLMERLGLDNYAEEETENDIFSEGIAFKRNKAVLVEFGIIKKKITKEFDIDAEVFYADFNWDAVLKQISTKNFKLKPIAKFQAAQRDFALLLDDSVRFGALRDAAFAAERKFLKSVTLFDVYKGKNLPEGKKSYALSFTIQDDEKTLTDKQIDKIMSKLQQKFETEFGASLR